SFKDDMKKENILFESRNHKEHSENTGSCLVVVTPDSQRTMNTYLGIAPLLTVKDIDPRLIQRSKLNYFEGYLWDNESTKEAISKAMEYAMSSKNEVAFTLSDPFCVERHRSEFLSLIDKYVNIVFANEDEAMHLFQCNTIDQAAEEFRKITNIAIITRSEKGSVVVVADGEYHIKAQENLNVIDTTGAGDLYAGGFLYGYINGYPLDKCGQMGTIAASEVIQHIGARPESNLREIISAAGFE
ncbi:MAG: adenosine kinase, partial [Rickettsiales bacterium]|nr:adenosine kinase [Rickettsiales bacterium]